MKASSIVWILILLMLGFMLLAPGIHGIMFFWFVLLLGLFLVLNMLFTSESEGKGCGNEDQSEDASDEETAKIDKLAGDILEISGRKARANSFAYEGPLRVSVSEATNLISASLEPLKREFFLQDAGNSEARLVILPPSESKDASVDKTSKPRYGLHWALFAATLLTTTWAGAAHQGINLLKEPGRFMVGVPYALGLMLILGAHEMGHYLTARRYRMDVSPPFFIPVPFALGTFGAFISMKSLPENRQNLFDVAVAGPLAGLVVAVPALLIGLPLSNLVPADTAVGMMGGGASLGSSVLFALLAKFSMGTDLSIAHNVVLHPLAFAGWLGLLVTALNLLPIGQLDGGHIAHAVFGGAIGKRISNLAMLGLFLLALFVWPGLLFFAILVFFIAGRTGLPPRDDVTPLSLPRRILGFSSFVLLILIIMPVPHGLYENFGLHCPYA